MNKTMKPCPFCGSYPRPFDDEPDFCSHYNEDCILGGINFRIEAWNKRAAESGTQPAQATNTGSPKLPSVDEIIVKVIPHAKLSLHDKAVMAGINECYYIIERQLRAGA